MILALSYLRSMYVGTKDAMYKYIHTYGVLCIRTPAAIRSAQPQAFGLGQD